MALEPEKCQAARLQPTLPFRPAAFLFDLDGVLVDSYQAHLNAYREALSKAGLAEPEGLARLVSLGTPRTRVLELSGVPRMLHGRIGATKEAAMVLAIRAGELPPVEGAREMLECLVAAGCRIGIVSNSATAQVWASSTGIATLIDVVVEARLVENPKPAPDLYHFAAEQLGVAPESCVAVEDTDQGVESAKSAGAFVVGVGPKTRMPPAHFWVDRLQDIPILKWLGD